MSVIEFLIVFACCAVTMLVCRVVPVFVLKGRELPDGFVRALNLIPPATFAALVANDLFKPELFSGPAWEWAAPLVAAAITVVVGIKTKSLAWCIVAGVGSLGLLMLLPMAIPALGA